MLQKSIICNSVCAIPESVIVKSPTDPIFCCNESPVSFEDMDSNIRPEDKSRFSSEISKIHFRLILTCYYFINIYELNRVIHKVIHMFRFYSIITYSLPFITSLLSYKH